MADESKKALIVRPSTAITPTRPGAKRIVSEMVSAALQRSEKQMRVAKESAARLEVQRQPFSLSPAQRPTRAGTVVAWGWNTEFLTNVPAGLSGVVAIAAGGDHTVALKSDGTVVAWGRNDYGQTYVPAGLSGVVAIAAGYDHTAALKSDGTVVAWGRSREGQTTVPTGLSGVVAIAAGGYHTVALVGAGSWLTSFYLMISLGGAIGGFLVAVVAHPAGEPDGERRR